MAKTERFKPKKANQKPARPCPDKSANFGPAAKGSRSIKDLRPEENADLRALFEAGMNREEMCLRFGIGFGGLYHMAKRDGWTDPKTGLPYKRQVKDAEADKRSAVLRKLSALGIPTSVDDVIPPSPDDKAAHDQYHVRRKQRRASVLLRHVAEWDDIDNFRRRALEGTGPDAMLKWGKVAKIAHETLMIKQLGERLAHNIAKGELEQAPQSTSEGPSASDVEVFLKTSLSIEELRILHSVSQRARQSIQQSQMRESRPKIVHVAPKKGT